MIDHLGISVSNLEKSTNFYEKALKPLGYEVIMKVTKEQTGSIAFSGFGIPPKPDFWIGEGKPNQPIVHIAFAANSRKMVDQFYEAAMKAGGKDNGAPGIRAHYHKDYYGAFVLDPDGHNIEVVCHKPE